MKDEHLDKRLIRKSFSNAAQTYDDLAGLQRLVGTALLTDYPLQSAAGLIMDLGCGTGFISQQLPINVEQQALVAVDIAMPMLKHSQLKNSHQVQYFVCADAEKLPFVHGSFQQIYSNLALQWCQHLEAVLLDCRRILANQGQLVFTTFGVKTLQELKSAWASVDQYTHVNDFINEQQLIALIENADFSLVGIENVVYQRHYPDVISLMHELKGIGAHNVNAHRNKQLTTRQQLQQMIKHYPVNDVDGHIKCFL